MDNVSSVGQACGLRSTLLPNEYIANVACNIPQCLSVTVNYQST